MYRMLRAFVSSPWLAFGRALAVLAAGTGFVAMYQVNRADDPGGAIAIAIAALAITLRAPQKEQSAR